MSQRKQNISIGEYYHLYNRGTDKRIIFTCEADYSHFLYLMYICNTNKSIELRNVKENFERGDTIIDIGAYCLMPNHFHILAKEKIEYGISKYMLKILTAYTMYFNKKYNRTGKLYEGVFKSKHADKDEYLKYLYSYIHLNPLKLIDKNWKDNGYNPRALKFILDYKYSSFREYMTDNPYITNPKEFPKYFSNIHEHKKEIFSWLNYTP